LHQSKDAIVVRRKSASTVSLAITATEAGILPPRQETSNCRKKPFDSVGALHGILFQLNNKAASFAGIEASQTLRAASLLSHMPVSEESGPGFLQKCEK
jgi:hypothetical protein